MANDPSSKPTRIAPANRSSTNSPLVGLPRAKNGEVSVPAEVLGQAPSSNTLAQWFEALGVLQRSAGGSRDFLADAAAAVCNPGGLDAGFVLRLNQVGTREGGLPERRSVSWEVDAHWSRDETKPFEIQDDIVVQVRNERCTLYHDAQQCDKDQAEFVIASPVFDREDKIVGVVYGIRSTSGKNKRRGVRPLEALWVQLVAESVTAAGVRSELEADLVRSRVMFESAFAPQIVHQLLQDPTALAARERELTMLFADLRDFTRTSEHLGPRETYRMLSDVMNRFTDQVMQHGGVIIDYYGDGMAAMWNAPTDQDDHTLRACEAALAIRDQMDEINGLWAEQLKEPLRIGVGLHTGTAIVGNAGSDRHLKYGPRGPAVNLTSRIETATKRLGVVIALTKAAQERVGNQMMTRRLCRARLAGIESPVEVFELISPANASLEPDIVKRLSQYEEALNAFEVYDYNLAEEILSNAGTTDKPSELLLNAVSEMRESKNSSPVLDLVAAAKS